MKTHSGTEKIIMTVALIVAAICGAKVVQEIAIIKYAVYWYFLQVDYEFALDVKAHIFPSLYYTSVYPLMAGVFLVISFWAGITLFQKTKTSNLKKLMILVVAVLLVVVCGFFTVKYIQDVTQQPPFIAQGKSDLWNEYQIHVTPKVRPIALFSFFTGGLVAVFFKFLRDVRKLSPTELPPRPEKPPPKAEKPPPRPEKPPEPKVDLQTLKSQLAKGEITIEEYESMKVLLEMD